VGKNVGLMISSYKGYKFLEAVDEIFKKCNLPAKTIWEIIK